MRASLGGWFGIVFLLFLAGCGGGSNPQLATTGGQGRATLTVAWPTRTRLIPDASNSIVVIVHQGTTAVANQTLARPAAGGTSTASFPSLPTGTLSVTATAYPNADGTGVAQATATIPLVILANQTTSFSITMGSTIDHVDLSATTATVKVGATLAITATAKDASGAVVLTTPARLSWLSSATGVATVDANGVVTGVGVGSADISVTDTESGKAAKTTVTVKPVGPISFAAPTLYSVTAPSEVLTADFDGDGKMDIVVGTNSALMVLYGKGDGTFETPQTVLTWNGGVTPYSVADMNGDGKPDLVCTVPSQIVILHNAGGRTFAAPIAIPTNTSLGTLVTGDFNGDGKQDIAVEANDHPGSTSTDIFIFLSQGSGVYTQGTTLGNSWFITGIKAVDLNADGKTDLLVSVTTSQVGTSGPAIYYGDGTGHFTGGPSFGTATANVDQTTVADFNGDGNKDLVIANSNDGSIAVIFGQGGSSYGTPAHYGVGPYPDHLVATDFDGDGHPDIIVENRDATHFTVLHNNNGLFPTTVQFPTGVGAGPMAVADFNGDGKPDVVFSSTSGPNISVILNNSP
ncbi:MAG: putative Ig proteinputative calcium-binding proteinFG-GAP repeat protein [Chthonomonadaceae bacterium]|nr:putative Ig proteinputative calcium-binding proteinFG-GAP repeat protein [Chthonomonadaceae bacterium]